MQIAGDQTYQTESTHTVQTFHRRCTKLFFRSLSSLLGPCLCSSFSLSYCAEKASCLVIRNTSTTKSGIFWNNDIPIPEIAFPFPFPFQSKRIIYSRSHGNPMGLVGISSSPLDYSTAREKHRRLIQTPTLPATMQSFTESPFKSRLQLTANTS